MKITLKINKELLHKNICDSKKSDTTLFTQLKEENTRLSKNIEEYFLEKGILEKKIYKMQQDFEDKLTQNREVIDKLNDKVLIMENLIVEKSTSNEVLKKELYKFVTNESLKKYRHVFIVEPTKANIDLNNELNYTRDIIAKVSKLMNTEKLKTENMQTQINNLQKELNLYRKSKISYEHETLANDMKIGKYYIKEESLESEDSSDDDNLFHNSLEDENNIDSPSFKFPDKVSMASYTSNNVTEKSVPKLDFTKVHSKYTSPSVKFEIKQIIPKKNDIYSEYNTVNNKNIVNEENKTMIRENRKMKAELKIFEKNNHKLKEKLKKFKNLYLELKDKFIKLTNALKIAQQKIEMQDTSGKKIPTTDDTVNKRNMNNTSMVNRS